MTDDAMDSIKKFKNFTNCWGDSYKFAIFSYVAIKRKGEVPAIICGTINLFPLVDTSQFDFFVHETPSIIAVCTVWTLDNGSYCFLSTIEDGLISQPDGKQLRLFDKDNDILSRFDSGTARVDTNQPRLTSLRLAGYELEPLLQKIGGIDELDCELRSHRVPFDGMADLLPGVGVHYNQVPQKSELLINALPLLTVDRPNSFISQGIARICCLRAPNLNQERLTIGVKPLRGKYSERKSINGNHLAWEVDGDGIGKGSIEINVGDSVAVQLLLSHNNILFDRWWIFDPARHINPSYAVHQAIDKELAQLKLFLSGQSKNPADNFENGVALLLSIFRFTLFHYGLVPTLRDGPDLLAFTQANELLIIDCTTGVPNENNKISKLLSRTEQIRTVLQSSGNSYTEILPVVITAISKNGIENDIREAARRGVVVITKENIDILLQRMQVPPTPSQLFAEAKSSLNEANNPNRDV